MVQFILDILEYLKLKKKSKKKFCYDIVESTHTLKLRKGYNILKRENLIFFSTLAFFVFADSKAELEFKQTQEFSAYNKN